MKLRRHRRSVAALAGAAFVAGMGASYAAQADGVALFVADDLDYGYMLAAKGDSEGKCGEGKCGESKDDAEGKCGEGKCGESKDDAEGKCGEGKCGGTA